MIWSPADCRHHAGKDTANGSQLFREGNHAEPIQILLIISPQAQNIQSSRTQKYGVGRTAENAAIIILSSPL